MSLAVVDSSVSHKWLCQHGEHCFEQAFEVLWSHRLGELTLVAPAILHIELTNSLRYSKYLTEDDTLGLIDALDELDIELIESTPQRLAAAARFSYRHHISIYDALFLALAEELRCPLITADCEAFAGIDTPVEIRLI